MIKMVTLIIGKKGSGKTKKLIQLANEAVANSSGNVVVIEKGAGLTYDVTHKARLPISLLILPSRSLPRALRVSRNSSPSSTRSPRRARRISLCWYPLPRLIFPQALRLSAKRSEHKKPIHSRSFRGGYFCRGDARTFPQNPSASFMIQCTVTAGDGGVWWCKVECV